MHRRPSQQQFPRESRFYTAISPKTTPAGRIILDRRGRIQKVELDEPFRSASPGLFFNRIVPVDFVPADSRYRLSVVKPHLWRSYIEAYGQNEGFPRVIQWVRSRQEATRRRLEEAGWRTRSLDLRLVHRMVVGLGAASVWETAMVWHRPTGLPYIPASAIKGLARGWIIEEAIRKAIEAWPDFGGMSYEEQQKCLKAIDTWFLQPDEETPKGCRLRPEALQALQKSRQEVSRLFGHTKQAGLIEFLDAFPVNRPKFELDVMNVHYPEYYQRKRDQALDIESPNPVVFLTVAATPFRFVLLCDTVRAGDEAESLLQKAAEALREALREMGIGAKTRLGYGLFQ